MLESIGVRIRADGRRLVLQVAETSELLRPAAELAKLLAAAEQRTETTEQARRAAEQRADAAETELTRLREELVQRG